jgi:hypothetical protein
VALPGRPAAKRLEGVFRYAAGVATVAFMSGAAESGEVVAFPSRGEVFVDPRGAARCLRVAWHTEADVVVLSLWQADRCTGSFRLTIADVPRFVQALVDGLGAAATSSSTRATTS